MRRQLNDLLTALDNAPRASGATAARPVQFTVSPLTGTVSARVIQ